MAYNRSRNLSGIRQAPVGDFIAPSYGGPAVGGIPLTSSSLRRSNSSPSLFGRGLHSNAVERTAPFHTVAVQRATPHFADKYPFVRYSYGNVEAGLAIKTKTEMTAPNYYGIKDTGTKRWLEGKLNAYNTGLFNRPAPSHLSLERPVAPVRNYVKYMPTEDAVGLFKKKCMTANTLSKYWLNSGGSTFRRDRDWASYGRSHSLTPLTGSYSSRYNPPVSSFASARWNRPTQYYSPVVAKLTA